MKPFNEIIAMGLDMNYVWFFLVLFFFVVLWRRIIIRFGLLITTWKRLHFPELLVKGEEKIGRTSVLSGIFSSILAAVYCIGIIWISFSLAQFPLALSILVSALAILTWLIFMAILFWPLEKFTMVISKLPTFLTTSKNSLHNWAFVYLGIIVVGLLFLGSILLVVLLSSR
jgi:hypothetical protein